MLRRSSLAFPTSHSSHALRAAEHAASSFPLGISSDGFLRSSHLSQKSPAVTWNLLCQDSPADRMRRGGVASTWRGRVGLRCSGQVSAPEGRCAPALHRCSSCRRRLETGKKISLCRRLIKLLSRNYRRWGRPASGCLWPESSWSRKAVCLRTYLRKHTTFTHWFVWVSEPCCFKRIIKHLGDVNLNFDWLFNSS